MVTGATNPFGTAMARECLKRKMDVICIDTDAQQLDKLAGQLKDEYPEMTINVLAFDMSIPYSEGSH